jgi:hypothetical protein
MPASPRADREEEDDGLGRGLSRTRSSQYLADSQPELQSLKDSQADLGIDSSSKKQLPDLTKPISAYPEDEEEVKEEVIVHSVLQEDFFSKDFDEKHPEDVMNKLKETSSQNELPRNENELPQELRPNRIYIEDANNREEMKINEDGEVEMDSAIKV